MLKRFLLALLGLIVILLLVGAMLSQHYECSRGIVVQAPAQQVFPLIAQLENWPQWDPFQELDPSIVTTLGATTTGVGASKTWTGRSGGGRLTIIESDPAIGVAFDMVFVNGEHEAPAKSWVHMQTRPDGSVEVVWGINGEMNLPLLGGFQARMADGMLGPVFERGLEKLKARAEGRQPAPAAAR